MLLRERYNKVVTGVISGIIIPLVAFGLFWLFTGRGLSLKEYFLKIENAGNITQIMSVSVFANIIIFLIFNKLDMLSASRGVVGITLAWAFVVFGIKLF